VAYLLSVAAVLAGGCATASRPQPATSEGRSFVVEARTYDEVWAASRKALLRHLDAIVESDKRLGRMTAERKPGLFTRGEVVRVLITPTSPIPRRYTVEVISEKRTGTLVTGREWGPTIIETMKTELRL
jgi:hypothetical protein